MAEEQLEASKSEKKKSSKLKWIILAVLLIALGCGVYFAWPIVQDKLLGGSSSPAQTEQTQNGEENVSGETELVTLPTFVVNLADPLGRRYLKLTLTVEVASAECAKKLSKSEAKVRDTIILLLSSKTFNELSSMDAKIQLKDEIVKRLNQIMGGASVLRVYFTEMVVQ